MSSSARIRVVDAQRTSEKDDAGITPARFEKPALLDAVVARHWLQLQGRLISGLKAAYVDFDAGIMQEGCGTVFSVPEDYGDLVELAAMAEMAGRTGAPVVSGAAAGEDQPSSSPLRVAIPLGSRDRRLGVVAVVLEAPLSSQGMVLQLLEWGAAWLDLLITGASSNENSTSHGLVAIYEHVAAQTDYRAAALAAVNRLAAFYSCDRISLGWLKGASHRIDAVSNLIGFSDRSTPLQRIQAAMDEAVDQKRPVAWPVLGGQASSDGHAALGAENNGLTVCTVPTEMEGRWIGALCFERRARHPFSDQDLSDYSRAAGCMQTLLALKRAQAQSFPGLILERIQRLGRYLFGSGSLRWKVSLLMGAILLLALSLWQGDYRVAAPALLEGSVQRAVVAPFAGYVADVEVRAGQEVLEGQLMLRLDDKDISLEYQRLSSERSELQRQYRKALGELDHAQTRIIEAQLVQADARLDLYSKHLERTSLESPIDGIVISGDWNRSLGVPVERGQVLFEVAPLDSYRVAIEVPDRDIAAVEIGQGGHLVLSALADQRVPLHVTNLTSMSSESGEGASFRVEAEIEGQVARLRPGMQGIAKVKVGERSMIWLWTHRVVDWLRYQFWSWLP